MINAAGLFYATGFAMIDFLNPPAAGEDADDTYAAELRALDAVTEAVEESEPLKADSITLSPRLEAFCLGYIETGEMQLAYALAFGSRPRISPQEAKKAACRRGAELLEHPAVRIRILELHRQMREQTGVTVEYLTGQYREAIDLAKSTQKAAALVQALNGLAKLHGLGIERKEVTVVDALGTMSESELRAYEAEIDAELAKLGKAGKTTAAGNRTVN